VLEIKYKHDPPVEYPVKDRKSGPMILPIFRPRVA
jgi:hypothetical protein